MRIFDDALAGAREDAAYAKRQLDTAPRRLSEIGDLEHWRKQLTRHQDRAQMIEGLRAEVLSRVAP